MTDTISAEGLVDKIREFFSGNDLATKFERYNLSNLDVTKFNNSTTRKEILTHDGVIELYKLHKFYIEKAIPFFDNIITSTNIKIGNNSAVIIENKTGDNIINELKFITNNVYKSAKYFKTGTMQSLGWSNSKLPHLKQLIIDNQKLYSNIVTLRKNKLNDMHNIKDDLWEHYDKLYNHDKKLNISNSKIEFITTHIYESWLEPIIDLLKTSLCYYTSKIMQSTFDTVISVVGDCIIGKKSNEAYSSTVVNLTCNNLLMTDIQQIESDGEGISIEECMCNLSANISYMRSLPMDASVYGNEGMADWFRSTIISIGNVLGHIANLGKTNVFKFYKELKRTELRYYNESNLVSMRMLFDLPFNEVRNVQIPIPQGMTCTYGEAVTNITEFLLKINAVERSKVISLLSKSLMKTIKSGSAISDILTKQINQCDAIDFKPEYDKYRKCFDIKPTTTVAFDKVFASISDMKKINSTVIDNEKHIHAIPMVHSALVETHNYFTEILKYLEHPKSDVITKTDIENVAVLARAIAEIFDFYGTGVMDFHRVEHNLVEVYKELRRQFNV